MAKQKAVPAQNVAPGTMDYRQECLVQSPAKTDEDLKVAFCDHCLNIACRHAAGLTDQWMERMLRLSDLVSHEALIFDPLQATEDEMARHLQEFQTLSPKDLRQFWPSAELTTSQPKSSPKEPVIHLAKIEPTLSGDGPPPQRIKLDPVVREEPKLGRVVLEGVEVETAPVEDKVQEVSSKAPTPPKSSNPWNTSASKGIVLQPPKKAPQTHVEEDPWALPKDKKRKVFRVSDGKKM